MKVSPMKKLLTLIALSAATISMAACTTEQKASSLPPGKYQKTTTSTDANGTTTEKSVSSDVNVDEYGNKRAVVKSKTSKDPRGLFNKTTNSTKVIEEENY